MVKAAILQALKSPETYGHPVDRVELVETHISWVFIAGELTYKLKKPVNLGFLDFTSLEKRRFYCHEEVRLNRRLAAPFYLGVVCIVQDETGQVRFASEEETPQADIADYAVQMRTIPEECILEHRLREGTMADTDLRLLAGRLVRFHQEAATGPEVRRGGRIETIRANVEENFEQTRKDIDINLSQRRYTLLKRYGLGFLDGHRDLLERRIEEDRIRECHGDLRVDHICYQGSEVFVFDCIEFNERFRHIDTTCDVAFLTMDLDFRGYKNEADAFIAAYLELSGDADMERLLPFYQSYYAYARGKIEDLRLRDRHLGSSEHQKMLLQAEVHFALALSYACRPEQAALIAVCGLSGTGKSRLAADLAESIRAELLRSDVLRKELHGIGPEEPAGDRYGAGIYSAEATRRTYGRLLELGGEALSRGKTVILDATFQKRDHREQARRIAEDSGSPFLLIECRCPEDVVIQRLKARADAQSDASDAGVSIYTKQKSGFEPIEPGGFAAYLPIETDRPPRETLQAVQEHLLETKIRRMAIEEHR